MRWAAFLLVVGLFVSSAVLLTPSSAPFGGQSPHRGLTREAARLLELLNSPVIFPTTEDEAVLNEATTLGELLDLLGDRYDICFGEDVPAFKAAGGKNFDIFEEKVCKKPLPRLVNIPLQRVVQTTLNRAVLPSGEKVTFTVEGSLVLITTRPASWMDLRGYLRHHSGQPSAAETTTTGPPFMTSMRPPPPF
jgi:hypothetical protein